MIDHRLRYSVLLAVSIACLCATFAQGSQSGTPKVYDGEGAIYVTPDRMEEYHFRANISEYTYIHPQKPVLGQKFGPDSYDMSPTARVHDCSDALFRCVALDDQAFAVPKRRLAPRDTYVADGNKFTVEKCLRGYENTCQVALIRAECFYSRIRKGCAPDAAERTGDDASWLLYFIYNEDFGVTCYGIEPLSSKSATVDDMMSAAKQDFLIGDHGLLKP